MTKFELTKDQKVLIGCTAVVAVVGAAVIAQDQAAKARLAKTMRQTNQVVDLLIQLKDSVDAGASKLDVQRQTLVDTSANIAKALSVMAGQEGGNNK